jgi:hypothetical protein
MAKKLIKPEGSAKPMTDTIAIRREAIADLVRVKEDFDAIIESLELMADKEFMRDYREAKEQIKNREFGDWNAL